MELHTAEERCIFLCSQQLGVHILIGFQCLLILIAVTNRNKLIRTVKRILDKYVAEQYDIGFTFLLTSASVSSSSSI